MRLWPKSLHWRLIVSVSLIMLVTQLVMVITVSSLFTREQRVERATHLGNLINFLRERSAVVEGMPLGQLQSLSDRLGLVRPEDISIAIARLSPPPSSVLPVPSMGRPDVTLLREMTPPKLQTADADLLETIRNVSPDVIAIEYRQFGSWWELGPSRPYEIESWVALTPNANETSYLRVRLTENFRDDAQMRPPLLARVLLDFGARIMLAVLIALLVTIWVVKPIRALADAADRVSPNGTPDGERSNDPAHTVDKNAPTEVAHTIAAFERMQTRIGSMVAERTTMLTALAHDLRTPITRLMLRVEMSSDDKLRAPAIRDLEKMQTLINSTLDFLRSADRGRKLDSVALMQTLHETIAELPEGEAAKVTLKGEDVVVRAHAWGVARIATNLIQNAIKYGHRAHVQVARQDGFAVLTVYDEGVGVPTSVLARLREPFFRVDDARNLDEGGAGLGLSIVDNLVRAYGGTMAIANASAGEGHSGLVVRVRFPVGTDA
jgi:signal transduction histidine kinase